MASNLTVTETVEENIRSSTNSPSLLSRKIWAMLYPKYVTVTGGVIPKVWELDSFLCDLNIIASMIEKWYQVRQIDEETFEMYWCLGRGGYTDIASVYTGVCELACARITLKRNDSIKVEWLQDSDDNS